MLSNSRNVAEKHVWSRGICWNVFFSLRVGGWAPAGANRFDQHESLGSEWLFLVPAKWDNSIIRDQYYYFPRLAGKVFLKSQPYNVYNFVRKLKISNQRCNFLLCKTNVSTSWRCVGLLAKQEKLIRYCAFNAVQSK